MNSKMQVLSIVESHLGHRTYGNLIEEYFSSNSSCKVDLYWFKDERELHIRILNKLLGHYYSRNQWVRKQNLDFFLIRAQLGFAFLGRRLAYRKLLRRNYSVLHFHTQPLAFLSIDIMKKVPTVISIDVTSKQTSESITSPEFRWTFAANIALDKKVFDAAASIVTFSESAQKSVIEDYQIDASKVKVVYPGVDLKKLPARNFAATKSHKPYKILFIGTDFERKGGYDLLQVFWANFSQKAELHLVTQEPIKTDWPNIYVYPNIKAYTREWLELYHQADVFVLPTYSEPFGWVFIEAMAAGLPVIATQINAIPEIVSHGETGFLIQPGDRTALAKRIQQLINNPLLGEEMGKKGRKVVEQKFNAQTNFQTLESIFRELAIGKQTHENSPHLSLQF